MENEQRFRLMADSAPVMVWASGPDMGATYFNRLWLEFTGRTIEQSVGDLWLEVFHPDDLSRCRAAFNAAFTNRSAFSIECRIRHFDGEYRTVIDNGAPWYTNDGQFAGFIGSIIDITARKQAEDILLASKELLRRQNVYLTALHETTLGIVNHLDWSTLLKTLVQRACDLIGTPHGFIDLIAPEEKKLDMQVGVGIYTRFIGYKKKKGEGVAGQVWLTQQPLIVNDYPDWPLHSEQFLVGDFHAVMGAPLRAGTQIIGVIGLSSIENGQTFSQEQLNLLVQFANLASIALDNARLYQQVRHHTEALELRVAERSVALGLQQHQTDIILQNAADAIVFTDIQGKILYVNPAWERLTGYSSSEVQNGNPRILQSGATPSQVYRDMWQTILAGNTWHGIVRNRRKSGAVFDADLTVVPIRDAQNDITFFVGVQRDVTETVQLQAQQRRFVANAAHELRTPLTNFKTRLYLARKQPEKFADHIEILNHATDHMARLVSDLLDLSRFETGVIPLHKEKFELKFLVNRVSEMVQPQADSKQIAIALVVPDQPLPLVADPVRIHQVLTNLLVNAIHYTPEGGHVEIAVHLEGEPPAAQSVIISVKDDGVGIAPENLPYVFQPFYRVNEQKIGTGLGLSIAKEIVERHGGEITVTSSVGQGTCFIVSLPLFM